MSTIGYKHNWLQTHKNQLQTHNSLQTHNNWLSGVRFSSRPVANGAQKWLQATSIFYYSGPHCDLKYLRSCNILDAAKINISEVLFWLYLA